MLMSLLFCFHFLNERDVIVVAILNVYRSGQVR